jgi:aspartate aminotransferase
MESSASSTVNPPISNLAEGLVGSEVIKIAGEINARIAAGETIYNLTIGDFNSQIFPLPEKLTALIQKAYSDGHTNYPQANGMAPLRKTLSAYIEKRLGVSYDAEDILISGGARPLIYATFRALLNHGEKVIFPIPSWNNNHYSYLCGGNGIAVMTKPEESFMPSVDVFMPYIQEAGLIALCSPLNPTGTCFEKKDLEAICDMVLDENKRRGDGKPVYLMYDQIYNELRLEGINHYHPVQPAGDEALHGLHRWDFQGICGNWCSRRLGNWPNFHYV